MAGSEISPQELVSNFRLPEAGTTAWGVPILGNDQFHRITAGDVTNYAHMLVVYGGYCDVFEWTDPEQGGVSVILNGDDEPLEGFENRKEKLFAGEAVSKAYTVGEVPGELGAFPFRVARQLGFRVLAHTSTITAVQLPGGIMKRPTNPSTGSRQYLRLTRQTTVAWSPGSRSWKW